MCVNPVWTDDFSSACMIKEKEKIKMPKRILVIATSPLSTAAEDDASVPGRAEAGLQGWIECFLSARMAGVVFAGGVNN